VSNKEEETDPELLALMVEYIRKQVKHMDSLNPTDLMVYGRLPLLPLKPDSSKRQQQQ